MPEYLRSTTVSGTRFMLWEISEDRSFFEQKILPPPGITNSKKIVQHLAGRYSLSALEPGFPVQQIQISPTNKPYLADGLWQFSISHCKNFAAVAISANETVGVDVECITPKVALIQHKFCNAAETRWLNSLIPSQKLTALTLIWSAKEALFKWWGYGGVDFSDHLLTQPFELNETGEIHAAFLHPLYQTNLLLRYYCWEQTVLVVASQYLPKIQHEKN